MKAFTKKTIFFFSLLYIGILASVGLSNGVINSKANFKLEPNINKIVLGNSHPAGTFNDSLISNFKNLADPGDCYFYGYLKLKELLKQNPQIDTVFIEFNPKTILKWEDSKLWRKHQIPNYLPFFEWQDHYLLATSNALAYQQELIKGIVKNIKRIKENQYQYIDSIGGFRHVTASRIHAILDTITYNPKKQYKMSDIQLSEYDIKYLKKMVALGKDKNIQLIFVRSPYHKKFDARNYEDLFQAYRKAHFGTIPFLDFKDFNVDDLEFKDPEHLNYKGARKFSVWFEKQSLKNE